LLCFFFSSRRRHTRFSRDWSSDVCSSDLFKIEGGFLRKRVRSFITECDGHTPGDKRHFPEALFQPFIIKIIPFQHGEVRFEGDDCPCAFSRLKRTNRFNWCQRHASTIRLLPQLSIALYLCYQFFRKGVYC